MVRDSFIHDLTNGPGDHADGIQCYQGKGSMTVVHNTIRAEGSQSNAAFFTADYCSGSLLLDNNLLSGGGYSIRVYANDATVTNNVIVKNSYAIGPAAVYSGPTSITPNPAPAS